MAQKQQTPKQPQDPYAQRGKSLTSSVQRLRGWVGSDPSRGPELADALVELTGHRLLGHGYAGAAADAQEAVRLAAQLLTVNGPIGPYTSLDDAARCVTAMVHVATLQVGLARPEAAGDTMASVQDLQQQLRAAGLSEQLTPRNEIWALAARARAALAAEETVAAGAHADAARALVAEAGLTEEPDEAYVVIDVDRLVSDCRWAAGRAEESLSALHLAKDRYDTLVAGRLAQPGRLSPALLERLGEPLFGLYRDLADRLVATGEVDLGLATRRALVELLHLLAARRGEPVRIQLGFALADLAEDLRAAGRVDEAEAANAEAVAAAPAGGGPEWARLLAEHSVERDRASQMVRRAAASESSQAPAAWLEAERAEAHRLELERSEQARLDAERRRLEQEEADRAAAERLAAEREQAEREQQQQAEREAAAEEAERVARKQRREERLEAHRLETEEKELVAAEEQWRDARARGDRRATRAANERVVELLRSRAEQDLAQFGPHLIQALEELSGARLRGGDVWGSRAPAREAKALARALGR